MRFHFWDEEDAHALGLVPELTEVEATNNEVLHIHLVDMTFSTFSELLTRLDTCVVITPPEVVEVIDEKGRITTQSIERFITIALLGDIIEDFLPLAAADITADVFKDIGAKKKRQRRLPTGEV